MPLAPPRIWTTSGSALNAMTWTAWNTTACSASTTATTYTMSDVIWTAWNATTATTSTSTYTLSGWAAWNDLLVAGREERTAIVTQARAIPRRAVSEEERARWAERDRRDREAYETVLAEQAAAKQRADELLLQHLTLEQRDDLIAKGCFYLLTQSGKKYRIERGRAGNVHLVGDGDRPVHRYCAHPREVVPDADTMLAQKLMLETDEAAFLKVANRHW